MIHANDDQTRMIQARYDRIAYVYDPMGGFAERRHADWRKCVWALVKGQTVLEVGIGTGRNIAYHPPEALVTGIDLSQKMLVRARRRAAEMGNRVTLAQMDVQALEFPDAAFDSAVATFVFCSVPDPVLGLREMQRVVKPDGRIVLLEHTRSDIPLLGRVMDALDPVVSGLMGPHINRNTVKNVHLAGLQIITALNLEPWGVFKLIVARTRHGLPDEHTNYG